MFLCIAPPGTTLGQYMTKDFLPAANRRVKKHTQQNQTVNTPSKSSLLWSVLHSTNFSVRWSEFSPLHTSYFKFHQDKGWSSMLEPPSSFLPFIVSKPEIDGPNSSRHMVSNKSTTIYDLPGVVQSSWRHCGGFSWRTDVAARYSLLNS